ncbi:hypothetical protein QFZ55_003198 [Streptomyces luteogriseus]|nr:hypothetical protein [Streptomyces luteogriseus]
MGYGPSVYKSGPFWNPTMSGIPDCVSTLTATSVLDPGR